MNIYKNNEIAEACNISTETIQDYENAGLIKRVRLYGSTGYKFYDVKDIDRILLIASMQEAGVSLSEMKDYLNYSPINEGQKSTTPWQQITAKRKRSDLRMRTLQRGDYSIIEETIPERRCLVFDYIVMDVFSSVVKLRDTISDCVAMGAHFSRIYPSYCMFPERMRRDEKQDDLPNGFPFRVYITVNKEDNIEDAIIYPEQKALALAYRGSFDGIEKGYQILLDEVKSRGYQLAEDIHEIYLDGKIYQPSGEYVMEIVAPVNLP